MNTRIDNWILTSCFALALAGCYSDNAKKKYCDGSNIEVGRHKLNLVTLVSKGNSSAYERRNGATFFLHNCDNKLANVQFSKKLFDQLIYISKNVDSYRSSQLKIFDGYYKVEVTIVENRRLIEIVEIASFEPLPSEYEFGNSKLWN